MYLNALADLSNLLFIAAYWAKDILWLRFLAMLGSLVIIPYYLLQMEPLWTPTMWSCVFARYSRHARLSIMKERRPIAFTLDISGIARLGTIRLAFGVIGRCTFGGALGPIFCAASENHDQDSGQKNLHHLRPLVSSTPLSVSTPPARLSALTTFCSTADHPLTDFTAILKIIRRKIKLFIIYQAAFVARSSKCESTLTRQISVDLNQ